MNSVFPFLQNIKLVPRCRTTKTYTVWYNSQYNIIANNHSKHNRIHNSYHIIAYCTPIILSIVLSTAVETLAEAESSQDITWGKVRKADITLTYWCMHTNYEIVTASKVPMLHSWFVRMNLPTNNNKLRQIWNKLRFS